MVSFPKFVGFALLATVAQGVDKPAVEGGLGCFTITDRTKCCDYKDGRADFGHLACVPAAADQKWETGNVCEPSCVIDGKCPEGTSYPAEPSKVTGTCEEATEAPATTTLTPWDSSASSSGDSDFLASSYTSSFQEDSESSQSSADSSLESSGSAASGSSGSYMPLWMWGLLIAALCLCCAAIAASAAPKKKKVPKKKPAPKGPAKTTLSAAAPAGATTLEVASQAGFKAGQVVEIDAGSPLAEIHDVAGLGSIILTAPLMYPHAAGAPVVELPDGRPLPELITTTSAVIPSYQMVAPVTTSYAAPQMYAPATTAYAAPATTAYAQPVAYSNAGYSTGAIV